MIKADCPVLGFAAGSGTGKTTLLEQLIPLLTARGLRIGMVKHAHHEFDIDQAGKDSYRLRHAGAQQMLIASQRRWALMVETPQQTNDPDLQALVDHLDARQLDVILVEGFKHVAFDKIELHRRATGKALLYPQDHSIIAIASDCAERLETNLPRLDLNSATDIADFIQAYIDKRNT